jgi:hypothetical protein
MSIPEFLNIYAPHMYPTLGTVTFQVRGGEEPVHRPREQVFQQQRLGGAILLHFRELGSCGFGASSFEAFRSL